MTSAAPPKRMVSSVFITLASPYKAKVTPTPQITQHSAVPSSPTTTTQRKSSTSSTVPISPTIAHRKSSTSSTVPISPTAAQRKSSTSTFLTIPISPTVTHRKSSTSSSVPISPTAAHRKSSTSTCLTSESGHAVFPAEVRPSSMDIRKTHNSNPDATHTPYHAGEREEKTTKDFFSPPLPSSLDNETHSLTAPLTAPPTCPPSDHKHKAPVSTSEVCGGRAPPAGQSQNDLTAGTRTVEGITPDVCGFCRKPVALSEPVIEALNRTYHSSCFQCRQCHAALAGKTYYNKAGIPLCEDCYQASLEPCWACGEVIKDNVIRALERAYHPPCFVCTTCRQPIGEQRFAQGEVGEVYCLYDYYRKYAPQCSVCGELIIPREDGTDSYTVECLGRSFHEDCYRCELCMVLLSPEPDERGCHPLDGQILCKPCHLSLIQTSQH